MGLWDVGLCLARVRNVIHTPLAFRSIPFRPRLLFCSQAPASRGAAVFFFTWPPLDPSSTRSLDGARSGSRNRGSCSRCFRLNAARETLRVLGFQPTAILSLVLAPLPSRTRNRGDGGRFRPVTWRWFTTISRTEPVCFSDHSGFASSSRDENFSPTTNNKRSSSTWFEFEDRLRYSSVSKKRNRLK